jgi:hypothetical protein
MLLFISNILYYNTLSSIIFILGYIILEYISLGNVDKLKTKLSNDKENIIGWLIDKIISIRLLYKETIGKKLSKYNESKEDTLIYNKRDYKQIENIENDKKYNTNEYYVLKTNVKEKKEDDMLLIKTPGNNSNFIKKKHHLQIELHIKNDVIDMNEMIKPYLVLGNKISSDLVYILMRNNLKIEIEREYKIEILTTEFNKILLEKDNYLLIEEDKYILNKIESKE